MFCAHGLRASSWRWRQQGPQGLDAGIALACSRARSDAPPARALAATGSASAPAPARAGEAEAGLVAVAVRTSECSSSMDKTCRTGVARRPAHAVRHRGVQRNPLVVVPGLEIDVREEIRPERIGSGQNDTNRVADGLDERAEHDRHVVAVAGLQLQHPPGGMEDLDPEGIFRVAHVALHPPEQRIDLAQIVFGRNAALQQDVDAFWRT